MSSPQTYINYLKANPKGYWFKAKWFGWGWVPARWQGWVVVAIYIALMTIVIENYTPLEIVLPSVILTVGLVAVCYLKGEKPRWSWGPPKKKNK